MNAKNYDFEKEMTIKNLKLLREKLKTVNPKNFKMDGYLYRHECRTTGCALGHCTVIAELIPLEKDKDSGYIDFNKYCRRIFPYVEKMKSAWLWLFSLEWAEYQNTPQDAVWRIDKLFELGFDFFEKREGPYNHCDNPNWKFATRDKCLLEKINQEEEKENHGIERTILQKVQ